MNIKKLNIFKIAWNEFKDTIVGCYKFYVVYCKSLFSLRLEPKAIIDWLILVLFLLIIALHPYFPPVLKLLSSVFVIGASFIITRKFIGEAKKASSKTRSQIRGGILALFPFYLVAVTTFIWGLWQVYPTSEYDTSAQKYHQQNQEQILTEEAQKLEKLNAELRKIKTTKYKIVRDQQTNLPNESPSNPLFNVLNDTYPGKTPDDKDWAPNYDSALTFWVYSLRTTLGISTATIFEKGHQFFTGADKQELFVTRLDGWNELMMSFEILFQLITSILFLGIIADIALAVQRKVQTGSSDIDLSRDFAVDLLTGIQNLDSLTNVDEISFIWDQLNLIRTRAVEDLVGRLNLEEKSQENDSENIPNKIDEIIRIKYCAILALAELKIQTAVPEIKKLLADPSLRVRSASAYALSILQPENYSAVLKEITHNGDELLQIAAIKILHDICDPSMFADDETPQKSAEKLFRKWLREMQPSLIKLISLNLHEILEVLVEIFSHYPQKALINLLISEYTNSESIPQKVGTLKVFKELANADSLDTIFKGLSDESDEVKVAAALALEPFSSDENNQKLIEMIADKELNSSVKIAALQSLSKISDVDIISHVIELLEDKDLSATTAKTLGKIAQECLKNNQEVPTIIFEALKPIVNQESSIVRDEACIALAKTKNPEARKLLETLIPDTTAVKALGILEDAEAIPALLKAAELTANSEKFSATRVAPLEALGNLGLPGLYSLMALYNQRKSDKETIALIISRSKHVEGIDFLIETFNPKSLTDCKILAPALASTGDPRIKNLLLDAVRINPESAEVIANSLMGLENEEAVSELLSLLKSFNDEIRNMIFNTFKFYHPKALDKNAVVVLQDYLSSVGNKAGGWVKKMNRLLHKQQTTQIKSKKIITGTINTDDLDEFD